MPSKVAAAAAAATFVAGLSSCRPAAPPPPGPMASALLATAAELGAAPEAVAQAWAEIDRIATRVERRRRSGGDDARGGEVAALTAVVFDDLGFAREIDDDDLRFFVLPSVLAARRGSCLGLGAVVLMVAERIGLPLDGVRVPGHFFVRMRGPSARNVELLRRGEIMPDAWYRQKYGPWSEDGGRYFVPLSVEETSALFWFNAGNFARREGDLVRARRAYERALAEAPDFAEARAVRAPSLPDAAAPRGVSLSSP
jgi:hypothetical protein